MVISYLQRFLVLIAFLCWCTVKQSINQSINVLQELPLQLLISKSFSDDVIALWFSLPWARQLVIHKHGAKRVKDIDDITSVSQFIISYKGRQVERQSNCIFAVTVKARSSWVWLLVGKSINYCLRHRRSAVWEQDSVRPVGFIVTLHARLPTAHRHSVEANWPLD